MVCRTRKRTYALLCNIGKGEAVDHRQLAREAIARATASGMSQQMPYHVEAECALQCAADRVSTFEGIDGREYRAFETDSWRVTLVLPVKLPSCQYR